MGSGFKFHMATIIAIFLALAVGLGVGSLFVSPKMVTQLDRTNIQITKLLKQDMTEKSAEVARYQQFLDGATPWLLRGHLDGAPVAIVQTGDYPESTAKVQDALRMAGARVVSTTAITRALDRPDEALNDAISEIRSDVPTVPNNRSGILRRIAATLARGDHSEVPLMEALDKNGLVSTLGDGDYNIGSRYVVIVAGSRTDPGSRLSDIDRPLIVALAQQGVTVVACEPKNVAVSDILAYRSVNIGVPAVPDVDTDIGRLTLVFALRNETGFPGVQTAASSASGDDHP